MLIRFNAPEIMRRLEATLLSSDATQHEVAQFCALARRRHYASVCVPGCRVTQAADLLQDSGVKVATLVGCPGGTMEGDVKRFETEAAIDNGAQEINVALNLGFIKDGLDHQVLRELRDVAEAAEERCVKVLLEVRRLSREEALRACQLVLDSGAHMVMLGSGPEPWLPTVADVGVVREIVGPKFGLVVGGRIADLAGAATLLEAGANRLAPENTEALLAGLNI